ncbi:MULTISPECIES: TetR/AcrR family transcriptional regulator [unclassified Nocardioides]|uniref:TetR/AcrR family transcriptional regulator n=1 Tax=unclassified Nocardioides TaxID=2615069 RepID=UPI0007022A86|nr:MULTISPECIES: helix-turn-helix domain-containing protein [unclassified Nocardioides]KRA29478.1 TetR family transcriptional regulator [Nocardioides sp. Root614]KRA88347.1 TetR family transcriptional regulator [Nocardioides sp. Root682]
MATAHAPDWLAGGDRRELAVRRLVGSARELLVERGVEKFSAEAVAARAGCSRATLYRYVGGRTALIDAVVAEAAATVAERVEREVHGLRGSERVVEAILASVLAIRADRTLQEWFLGRRTARSDEYFSRSGAMAQLATRLTGMAQDHPHGGDWVVRVVLSLLAWPGQDPDVERDLVVTYVAPAFA